MIDELAAALLQGERAALSKAITLAESVRSDHAEAADELLTRLMPSTGSAKRIGISGTPGVGKSTFIEQLGLLLLEQGHRVAVLAIDPSSTVTGGSILGDKTRMTHLSRHRESFIRATPSSGVLGGVAEATRDALLLCEAAGYDTVLVETVGIGQSETDVADIVDLLLLLVAPGGGDDLQGIKRGVLELADVIAINKADTATRAAAERTAEDYRSALSLVRPKRTKEPTEILLCSALEQSGINELWIHVLGLWSRIEQSGELSELRRKQAIASMWRTVGSRVRRHLEQDAFQANSFSKVAARVDSGQLASRAAASELLGSLGLDARLLDG